MRFEALSTKLTRNLPGRSLMGGPADPVAKPRPADRDDPKLRWHAT